MVQGSKHATTMMRNSCTCVVVGLVAIALCYLSSSDVRDMQQQQRHAHEHHHHRDRRLSQEGHEQSARLDLDPSSDLLDVITARERTRMTDKSSINSGQENPSDSSTSRTAVQGAIFGDTAIDLPEQETSTTVPTMSPSSLQPASYFPTHVPTVAPSSSPTPACKVFGYGGVCQDSSAKFYDTCFGKLEPTDDHQTCMDLCLNTIGLSRCLGISYGMTHDLKYCYLHLSTAGDSSACDGTNLLFADYVTDGAGEIGRLFPFEGYKCYKCQ